MSKIADRILIIPENVSVKMESQKLVVDGPNGLLFQDIPTQVFLIINEDEKTIKTQFSSNSREKNQAILGTINSLINNMLKGVKDGHQKILEIKGVGYNVTLTGQVLKFSLGYSHDINLNVPETLKVDCLNNVKLIIKGVDKQEVGWFAAKIKKLRKPNVFVKSLKGVFYQGETVKIKSGKKEAKK